MDTYTDFKQRQAERYERRMERREQEHMRAVAAAMKLAYVVVGAVTLYVMLFLGCFLATM